MVTIDATGTYCPMPILKLAQRLRELTPGAEVELLATDPAVEEDVRAFCEGTGNELQEQSKDGEVFRARIRKR